MSRAFHAVISFCLFFIIFFFVFLYPNTLPEEQDNEYLASIKLGGEWFLNNQDMEFIKYHYYTNGSGYSNKYHALNQMGALWTIARLHDFLEMRQYDSLSKKGLRYFESYLEEDLKSGFLYINITPKKIKLGYSAMMILSLLEMEHKDKDVYLEGLANGILDQQELDGSFRTHFFSDNNAGIDEFPGQALFALMSLFEQTGDKRYLEATIKGFLHYRSYWKNNTLPSFVPWQTRAFRKLFDHTKIPGVAELIFEMNDLIIFDHFLGKECVDFDFSPGVITSYYLEGVVQAFDLAEVYGDVDRMTCYKNFISEASDYLVSHQIGDLKVSDRRVLGGFPLKDGSLRADMNQHATIALMDAYSILRS